MAPSIVLVTGASGYLGSCLVQRLSAEGYSIRALVRPGSPVERLEALGVRIVQGDLGEADSVARATAGVSMVVHAGAGTRGTEQAMRRATVDGTRNVLDACARHGVRKLVYVSSCSVYDVASQRPGSLVTEDSPLESHPDRRGGYSAAKQEAERLVAAVQAGSLSVTILRPGVLYGRGKVPYPPMVGIAFPGKALLVFGDGKGDLPLAHVDNVVEAIVLALRGAAAGVFNVVDDGRVTRNDYVQRLVRPTDPGARVLHVPLFLLRSLTALQELAMRPLRRKPFLTNYRLESALRPLRYGNDRIKAALRWMPRKGIEDAVDESVPIGTGVGERVE